MSFPRPVTGRTVPSCPAPTRARRVAYGWLLEAAAIFALLLAAGPVFGQETHSRGESSRSGSIHGTVTTLQENTSSGLAGVILRLTPGPDGGALTAGTDEAGQYEFKGLKPGTYAISINQPGFKPYTKTVAANAGQATATESASTPSVTLTQRQLISLPTAQEKIREVLPVTPGVVKTQDGKLNFKGADENQSLLLVNSARTTDPVTGSFSVPVPTDAVQSFAVYKTPYNAGLGSFSGGLTVVETKPPDDRWNYRLKSFIPSVLGKNGSMIGLQEATPGLDFGVPLLAHKLLFSEIFQYDMKKRTLRGLPWPNDISKKQGFSSFSTVEAILS